MKKGFKPFVLAGFLGVLLSTLASSAHAATAVDAYQAGVSFYKQGLYDQCIDQENAAIALDPTLWQAYQVKGYCYFKEGNTSAALDAYHQCLQVNPNNPKLEAMVNKLEAQNGPALPAAPVVNAPNANQPAPSNNVESEAPINATSTPVMVNTNPVPNSVSKGPRNLVIQIEGGLFVPASSQAASQLTPGYALGGMVGFAFTPHFTLGLEVGSDELNYNTSVILAAAGVANNPAYNLTMPTFGHVPVEVFGQYSFGESIVKPYVFLGCGIAFDSVNGKEVLTENGLPIYSQTINNSWTNLEIDPGAGVEFKVDKYENIFLQAKLDMDFGPTANSSSTMAETTDSPIIIVPLEIGFNSTFQ
jgi:hypothetical protein